MAESVAYRSIIVASQYASWLLGQLLRVYYSIQAYRPAELFEHRSEHCLILAPTHQSFLDPWLMMISLGYRHVRALVPVRILGTQDPRGALKWFMPVIKIMYWLAGVIELPPEDRADRSLPEKLRAFLVALKHGDVVMIFPEGNLHRERDPPVNKFASGVVYVHRKLGAPIVPVAVWTSRHWWPRRRYVVQIGRPVRIPEDMDQDAGAVWLREQVLALYEQARQREER